MRCVAEAPRWLLARRQGVGGGRALSRPRCVADALARAGVALLHHAVRLTACAALPRIRVDSALRESDEAKWQCSQYGRFDLRSSPPTPTHKHFVPQSRSAMSDTRCTPLLAVESAGWRESVCMSRSSGREVGTRCSGAGSLTMAGAVLHQRSWVGACAKSSLCPWDEMFVCREALFPSPSSAGLRLGHGIPDTQTFREPIPTHKHFVPQSRSVMSHSGCGTPTRTGIGSLARCMHVAFACGRMRGEALRRPMRLWWRGAMAFGARASPPGFLPDTRTFRPTGRYPLPTHKHFVLQDDG